MDILETTLKRSVTLQREHFLSQDEKSQEFGGKYFYSHYSKLRVRYA